MKQKFSSSFINFLSMSWPCLSSELTLSLSLSLYSIFPPVFPLHFFFLHIFLSAFRWRNLLLFQSDSRTKREWKKFIQEKVQIVCFVVRQSDEAKLKKSINALFNLLWVFCCFLSLSIIIIRSSTHSTIAMFNKTLSLSKTTIETTDNDDDDDDY